MDILDKWLDDLPQQFQGKKYIEALISVFAKQLEDLYKVFKQLDTETDLDSAVGMNLDMVGDIVTLTRKEAGVLAGIDVEDPVISDERYRQFLKYQMLVNTNECTYHDLMDGLALLWDPIVCKGMISDTYSCIEDRGQLKSMQRLAGWVDFVEKSGERWYYLKMDVEKFFYRMDHEVLMSIIRKKIGDKEAVRFLEHYVCHASRAFGLPLGVKSPLEISDKEMLWDVGIAIGGGLSHMYGNMYLNPMDQMAKRKEGIQYYIRYMDDVIILSTDKELLHRYKNMFSDFLGDVLKLRLNNKTAIRPVSHGMEFVGYTIRPFDVRLRKSTSLRMKRHLKTIQELYRDYEIDLDRARSTLMSYKALMDHCDCRALEKKIFEDFVLTHNPKEADTDNG